MIQLLLAVNHSISPQLVRVWYKASSKFIAEVDCPSAQPALEGDMSRVEYGRLNDVWLEV
jgi:hypothetical protein